MRLALARIVVGALGALTASRLIEGLLFGIEPGNPVTFATVCAAVALVALAASSLPALRATRVDPVVARRVSRQ